MEASSLRLRFTPLFKNIRKNDSKCCLEIIPEVSCIQNLDKIQWQKGDNSIEYTIPITYKVILKKKETNSQNGNVGNIRTYHSCVDLLIPSSSNDLDIGSGDITKIVSDTAILNTQTDNSVSNDVDNKDTKKQAATLKEDQTIKQDPTRSSCTEPKTSGKQSKKRAIKDESSQILDFLDTNYVNLIKKIYLIDKVTSTCFPGDIRNQNTSAEILACAGTIDCVSSTGGKVDRKLSITPIYSINTNDENPSNRMKDKTSNLIVLRIREPQYNITLCDKYFNKFSVSDEKHGSEVIKLIKDNSFERLTNNSNERILPEVRVAQFKKILERELSPLKNMLNEMILKCSLLGFICRDNQNPMYDSVSNSKKEMACCKKESKTNRVVYSIVFDG